MEKPKKNKKINWKEVIKQAENCLDASLDDDDSEHYLYEDVMEAIYGKKVWKYINNNDRSPEQE